MAIKSLSIRIDTEMRMERLLIDCVAAYEKEHGQIVLGKQTK